ncbi:MAG: aminotransferase class III-fold pyridoxal phosphate-dependent enzyme, partial [Halanaerobiales bacterium]
MEKNLLSIDDALDISRADLIKYYKEYVNPGLATMLSLLNFDKQFVRARGTSVWDSKGNEYLDFLGGYGSLNLGHNPPAVLEAVS